MGGEPNRKVLLTRISQPFNKRRHSNSGQYSMGEVPSKEPRRCLKCQSLTTNHLAASCDQWVICGTCGGKHHMVECAMITSNQFWCASCQTTGHASWDRLCPTFVATCKQLKSANPK